MAAKWKIVTPCFGRFKNAAYSYKWSKEVDDLLPEHYKKRCFEFMTREPTPVHWRPVPGRWKIHPTNGQRAPVQNLPVQVVYPEACNRGLWGGEGIIRGFVQKPDKTYKPRLPKLWPPYLTRRPLYSEILNKWYNIMVTLRTLDLIDDAFGFDHYILKTHERDLNSKLGIDLKREMLLALSRKSLYPDDPERREKVYYQYKDYIIPEEEAEWVGLSVSEAIRKVKDNEAITKPTRPLKELLTQELVESLQENQDQETSQSGGWLSKLSPFQDKDETSKRDS